MAFHFPGKTGEIMPSPLPPTSYNCSFFILDAAFYAAIGYGIVFPYARLAWKQKDRVETQASKPVMRLL